MTTNPTTTVCHTCKGTGVEPHVETPVLIDQWIPACGGTEQPFKSRSGVTLLYCWNPMTGKHAYLNVDTDIILSDEEAQQLLGNV